MKEDKRGLLSALLQRWPLKLIEHVANMALVTPSSAGPPSSRSVTSLAVYSPFWPHILERNFILFAIHTGKKDYRITWKAKTTKSPSAA